MPEARRAEFCGRAAHHCASENHTFGSVFWAVKDLKCYVTFELLKSRSHFVFRRISEMPRRKHNDGEKMHLLALCRINWSPKNAARNSQILKFINAFEYRMFEKLFVKKTIDWLCTKKIANSASWTSSRIINARCAMQEQSVTPRSLSVERICAIVLN